MKNVRARYLSFYVVLISAAYSISAQPSTSAQPTVAEKPEGVVRPAVVFDSKRRKLVLFGGGLGDTVKDATWEYDGKTWINCRIPGPPARSTHGMVFDSRRGKVVLFGGYADRLLGDTWEYDGNAWRQVATAGPSPRGATGMAYDSRRGKTVLFGGVMGRGQPPITDTWEWDGQSWSQVPTTTQPAGNLFHKMAYDEKRGQVISFGGRWGNSETWAFDGKDWNKVSATGPPPRDHHAMTYDNARGKIIVFGGGRQLPDRTYPKDEKELWLSDLWEWDGQQWVEIASTGPPSQGGLPGLAYDSGAKKLVLFGGGGAPSGALQGTWQWDGKQWAQIK